MESKKTESGMESSGEDGLTLEHSSEQYAGEYDQFASIEAELESMNAEEVTTTEEEIVTVEEHVETEEVIPDVEMADVSEEHEEAEIETEIETEIEAEHEPEAEPELEPEPEVTYTPVSKVTPNTYTNKSSIRSMANIQPKATSTPSTQSQSIMLVSPAGQGTSQFLKISHSTPTPGSQIQTLGHSLITAKSAEGNIVHLRSAQPGKPHVATCQSGNITLTNVPPVSKMTATSMKRPAQPQNKNVFAKMIISGGKTHEVAEGSPAGPTYKVVQGVSQGLSSTTKTITLAQAQQMGLVPSGKVQHILPSPQQKGIVNKVIQTSSQPPKLTLIPTSSMKTPTKILPAPTTQVRSSQFVNSKGGTPQNSQKVIIRQSALKTGSVVGGGQIIRIPANQNIVTSNQLHQIQVPGRQVQYVRLVSTAPAATSNVVTVGKPKAGTTVQSVGITQKIGGQQQIIKVLPLNTSGNHQLRTVAPKSTITSGGTQRLLIPASGNSTKNALAIPASALSQLTSGQAVLSTGSNMGNIVVLPAQYIQQQSGDDKNKSNVISAQSSSGGNYQTISLSDPKIKSALEPNGLRPRKPCNCTKSQCLKLYCDCFANGEFCHMCNCNNCSNNLGNEEERQRAIKSCLERNPSAFRPKIGKARETGDDIRRHNKGCNCKRSGCLKNYCECYEAKIPCSGNCKCVGCRNIEDPAVEKKTLKDLAEAVEVRAAQLTLNKTKIQQLSEMAFRVPAASNSGARQPFNFLTDKVVEITCQCLMAQADEAERSMFDEDTSERMIIEEFGRCLKEIIDSAHKAETAT